MLSYLRRWRRRIILVHLALAGHLVSPSYNLIAEVHDAATGALIERQEQHNLVTTAGLNLIRDLLSGSGAGLGWFGVGTGAVAPAITDTALGAEVARQAFTTAIPTSAQLTITYYLNSGTANGSTLAEVGLFNASSSGSMYARALLSSTIAKTSAVTVTFTWILTWS